METLNKSCHQHATHFLTPKAVVVHGEVTLSVSAHSGWTTSADAVLPASVHRGSLPDSFSGSIIREMKGKKSSEFCVLPRDWNIFENSPCSQRDTDERGGCCTYSKVTKLPSYQLFTSKSKGRGYTLMLREYSACHKPPGLWLVSALRCVFTQWSMGRERGLGHVPSWCKLTHFSSRAVPSCPQPAPPSWAWD